MGGENDIDPIISINDNIGARAAAAGSSLTNFPWIDSRTHAPTPFDMNLLFFLQIIFLTLGIIFILIKLFKMTVGLFDKREECPYCISKIHSNAKCCPYCAKDLFYNEAEHKEWTKKRGLVRTDLAQRKE